MPKSDTEATFDHLVSKIIWPLFKGKGYKKSGNNFKYYDESGWGKIVNFQKSQWGNKDAISFTVNVGLYLPETERFHCGKESKEKFTEPSCIIRNRIGKLLPANIREEWFDVNPEVNREDLFNKLEGYFSHFISPYLDTIQSKQSVLDLLVGGYRSFYMPAQILTLYSNGYKDLARQQLNEEFLTAKNRPSNYLEWLKDVEQKML